MNAKELCLKINTWLSAMYQEKEIRLGELSMLAQTNKEAMKTHNYQTLVNTMWKVWEENQSSYAKEILDLLYQQ